MKKIISVLLAMACLLALACGCETGGTGTASQSGEVTSGGDTSKTVSTSKTGGTFMHARTYASGEGTPWTFDNTYYKLTHDKEFTVAYIGGSVTVGTGSTEDKCWRSYTTKWFRENYPKANIVSVDSGYGGTASLWGLARLDTMILSQKPDLIFVEFSVNDQYNGITDDQSAALMDGIVRKINKQLPNCDVVIVTVVDNATVKVPSLNAKAHEKVAKYYGITYLDMGIPLNAAMKKTGNDWGYYASDSVHPNAIGYGVYADYVKEQLGAKLAESKKRNPAKLTAHTISEQPYTSNSALKAETVWAKDIKCDSSMWGLRNPKTGKYGTEVIRAKQGSTLDFTFKGSLIGMFGEMLAGCKVEAVLNGKEKKNVGFGDKTGEVILFDNLDPNVEHTVTITVTGTNKCEISAFLIG